MRWPVILVRQAEKNAKKLTSRLAAIEFCTSMLRARHAVPYTYTFLRLQINTFSMEKSILFFHPKILLCWMLIFFFMQRWNNRRKIGFAVYSILIKAKTRSNMNTALIRALTNVTHDFACTLDPWQKKGTNDLSLDSTINVRQGRNKISKWIWYAFDSCQRQGQTWQ